MIIMITCILPCAAASIRYNISSNITAIADSPAEKRGKEGHRLEQTLIVSLTVGLLICLIFNLVLVVIKHHGCRFRLNIRRTQPIFACVSRVFPPAVLLRHDSVLPLHQLAQGSQLPTDHGPSPVALPRIPEARETLHPPPQSSRSSNASGTDNASQYSLALSDTSTMVPERPRRGFF
ncbi:hypothetical protein B0H19DRAFT_1267547 [Mycena capillaripes]|nr:hypothetical protein B0H19DRAFT_1267547 [Mycena capillaripes]